MIRANRYSPELSHLAVRRVRDDTKEFPMQRASVHSIAANLGCTAKTPRRWVLEDERNVGERPGLTIDERDRFSVPEKEIRKLRRTSENLRKASALFAEWELDLRPT